MKNVYTIFRVTVLFAIPALGQFAVANTAPAISDGSQLYAPCAVCHQANAWGSTDGNIPNLAGQQKRYLERQLIVFRSGARDDTGTQILAAHSTLSNTRSVVEVASYLSGLEANPHPVTGSGDHLFVGEDLYTHICAACHGDRGGAKLGNVVPRIGGQHYPYLRREIEQAADFHTDLAPAEMTSALRSLSAQEKDALADYISRLGTADPVLESKRLDGAATYH